MRRFLRALSVLLGLALLITGVAVMIAVGPDNTITSGDHPLATKGQALATSPKLLQYYGPNLQVSARSTTGKPVFVGVAGQADSDSYLAGTPKAVVDRFSLPWAVHTTVDSGGTPQAVKPAGLDFWVVQASGAGQRSVSWPMANGPYSIVVMNADGSTGVSVRVRTGLQIANAFPTAAGVAALGLLLAAGGWLLLRRRSTGPDAGPAAAADPEPTA